MRITADRILISGIASPFLAALLGRYTYRFLTRASEDLDGDFVFRLGATAAAMALPFVWTLVITLLYRRHGGLGVKGGVGLFLAITSLGLTWLPLRGAIDRADQAEMLALEGVPAPDFETADLEGEVHRLSAQAGKVVLINVWATWCGPCRREMPRLDELYQRWREDGLVVFGISTEDPEIQREFAVTVVEVSYPLLRPDGEVPEIYRTTARYPANYLVDRDGRLTRAPSTDRPFEELEARVAELLGTPQS